MENSSNAACLMDIEAIREYLPHRYPFLLVDRVTELEVGKYIRGYKNISCNEPFFQGHFPNKAIMPGVLILEAMAQVGGILGFKTMNKKPSEGTMYLFVGSDNIRFKRPVVPGDQLWLEAEVVAEKRGIWKFACTAKVNGDLAATAEILVAEKAV